MHEMLHPGIIAPPSSLTPEERFHDLADAGANVFLTGQAGTGKTYQLRQWLTRHPEAAVTASTGVAALNAGGSTIHRWSGMLIGPAPGQGFADYFRQLSRDSRHGIRAAFNRVREADRLVIDEISMMPGRLLDYLDYHCRAIRDDQDPFGGIQVIATGDGAQLPPVRTNSSRDFDWFFDSRAWGFAGFRAVELTTIRRQEDKDFARALGKFRLGEIDRETTALLKPRVSLFPDRGLTRLLTHNVAVDRWNSICLAELPGVERIYQAETWGPSSQVEFLTKNLLTPATLRLKVGSRVMFTVNRPDSGFVNGQTGEVVEVYGTGVTVETHGSLINVEPFTWLFDQADRSAGAFKQYPLRLASAVTIHRSQGISLDAAFIDIRAAREPGQAYVALSRVRSLAGLHLKDWPRGIFVSQRALDFQAACRADQRVD